MILHRFKFFKLLMTVILVAFLLNAHNSYGQTTIYVDDNYCSGCWNDGYTWGVDAFDEIQDGIDAVSTTGTVHVAAGTYIENITMKSGVKILGAGKGDSFIEGTGNDIENII